MFILFLDGGNTKYNHKVLSGENRVKERQKIKIKMFSFLVMSYLCWDEPKNKVGHL